ncbi:phosphotransferase [Actinokineospora guangxiensis]|uniref:Phosphotransferase n=1 Tax=Actinokineospora guangxiensis TaxID=1490288 RepID=A0ABW0EHJ9_9PSEU
MNLLLVEDSPQIVDVFEHFCRKNSIDLTVTRSLLSASNAIRDKEIDLDAVICDLKIPSEDHSVDLEDAHGLLVVDLLEKEIPGVPVLVLSAFGSVPLLSQMLVRARRADILGTGTDTPMLRFVDKPNLKEAHDFLIEIKLGLDQLAQIELIGCENLTPHQCRTIKIFARPRRGAIARFQTLAGGLSGAQTGVLTIDDESGSRVGHVVAKITTNERAVEEEGRYSSSISSRLGAGTYADLGARVTSGCGRAAALFYSVADTYRSDLFGLLNENSARAASAVAQLQNYLVPWTHAVPHTSRSWLDVRRELINDEDNDSIGERYDLVEIDDTRRFQAVWSTVHGDLHGANVLVDSTDRPVLIDYGRSGLGPSCLDPITLELSILFHKDSKLKANPWPSVEQLQRWGDIDSYVIDCPYGEYLRACRSWTTDVSAATRDVWATVAAYCRRNLRYDDIDNERAVTLHNYAATKLNESFS